MNECEKECVFNSNNECWLACKNKFYNQALEDFYSECERVSNYGAFGISVMKEIKDIVVKLIK